MSHLQSLPLARLIPHPGNANVMPAALFRKLCGHIRRTGQYPALIVRPHPESTRRGEYEILDGHHRARALREAGHTHARCDVWEVDDRGATLLLLTLNRLEGTDDPGRRARLLDDVRALDHLLADSRTLASFVPEDAAALERLRALAAPPAMAAPPLVDRAAAFEPLTFFLTAAQRALVLGRLSAVGADRAAALLRLLGVEDTAAYATPQACVHG